MNPSSAHSREQYSPMNARGLRGQYPLVGAGLQELSDPQATCVARSLAGRQRMVGADHFVTVGDIGVRAEEQRAVIGHALEEEVRLARHDLHVLGGELVGYLDHFILSVAHDYLPEIAPRLTGDRGRRQDRQLALDFEHGRARQFFRVREQHGGRCRTVLRLT